MDVIDAWKEVCIQALEMRRVAQEQRSTKNVLFSESPTDHSSFQAMEALKEEGPIVLDSLQVDQLLKALYWIPEKIIKNLEN